ncbi:Nitrilase/cyanide hydratase and apolipoprotein N-acyltransferase [Bacteroides coprosuis DSM 18011]|uniref:Nitrilase/cyanide hydratase and apolipoprotein N-acyltransferase n=1 Tax=Bacteroides coprosuis DSM 18011 TaxID=679937 RepID=F3ZPD8_9BACE|nr:bifunctional GNAT family N-acetyltransferase/carbon-nitrogen hydrolase family protein [Bacteroides coprosuis]EGJ71595.1 Nitrilase/cyanide hydratase and apolipoprotein N-acyltransferase [Bacteroides coprosuis DSM 18011]HJD92579.1 bifunctional GNAT family N-acetyltransferase/carbon-nitrogen hydrolase family protein [Bacteroides coprosuis]
MNHSQKINKVEIRNLQMEDYEQLFRSFYRIYADGSDVFWTREQISSLIKMFPEGQIVILVDGKAVGCALSIIVDYGLVKGQHTYSQVTADETFSTHKPDGNILYGIEIFVHPDYRGLRLARRMYDYRKELCETLNLKSIMFGGRIPNYHKYADELRPKEYIQKVRQKDIFDPVLTFQISNDFHVRRIMTNYLPNDEESCHYACLLQWDNIYYQEATEEYIYPKSTIRVGAVQWQMRNYRGLSELFEQIDFFVDSVSAYNCDFVLFPEYFNAPLMAKSNDLNESQAIRKLAEYTEEIRDRFIELAISHNINIITGSMPYKNRDTGNLLNVGFLCRRDGTYEMYEKIHVTPDEEKSWGLRGGDRVKAFDTDCAKIGVLICYDSEFPELSRVLAADGMQILFIPFLTDTQNAYSRVRVCAQARAIENECYVVIAGSVGNLPRVHNMDIQYAQSAVFTPCDFAFPTDGKRAEATPNTEMILITDVDLDLLNKLHSYGSVRNLKNRRRDLYSVNYGNKSI